VSTLVVLTKSYGPDFELCADLNASLLRHAPDTVGHQIVVPRRDLERFAGLAGPRTVIRAEADFLPRSMVAAGNLTLNLRRPWPPVRGWILQQIVKLAAAARAEADAVLMADSDVVFVRPFDAETFRRNGAVRFYRRPGAIDARLPRHVRWHARARRLLGLPAAGPPLTDYINSPLACDPVLVRGLLDRVAEVNGREWTGTVGAELHFSEWILYGVYVDQVAGTPGFVSDDPLCHGYWDEVPLDGAGLDRVLDDIRPTDVAVMISAKSRTPVALRRAALDRFR